MENTCAWTSCTAVNSVLIMFVAWFARVTSALSILEQLSWKWSNNKKLWIGECYGEMQIVQRTTKNVCIHSNCLAICKHANRSMFVKPIYSLSVFELAFCLLAFARWVDQKSIKNVPPPPPPPSSTWWTRTFEFESFFLCSSTSVSMLTDWLAGELNFHYYRIISENQVWKNDSIPRKRKGTLERACPQTETAPRK